MFAGETNKVALHVSLRAYQQFSKSNVCSFMTKFPVLIFLVGRLNAAKSFCVVASLTVHLRPFIYSEIVRTYDHPDV